MAVLLSLVVGASSLSVKGADHRFCVRAGRFWGRPRQFHGGSPLPANARCCVRLERYLWGSRVLGALPLRYQLVVLRGGEGGDAWGEVHEPPVAPVLMDDVLVGVPRFVADAER